MIVLEQLEAIAGFRWGAFISIDGEVFRSDRAPDLSASQLLLAAKMAWQAPFSLTEAELSFSNGKAMIRRCQRGIYLLFCTTSHQGLHDRHAPQRVGEHAIRS